MVRLTGASECASYSLYHYMERLSGLDVAPTLIILGPSLPEWSDTTNQERIRALIPALRLACGVLWKELEPAAQEVVWKLSA